MKRWIFLTMTMGSIALSAVLLTTCTDAGPTNAQPVEFQFSIVDGDGQTGLTGEPLADPLTVLVQEAKGSGKQLKPAAGVLVNFVVTEGGGSVFAGAVLTDKDGLATDFWTLGPEPGLNWLEVRSVYSGIPEVHGTFWADALQPNRPPEKGTVVPGEAAVGVLAYCDAVEFVDPDGDDLTYEWIWLHNQTVVATQTGVGTHSELPDQGWVEGDELECRARASDGTLVSEWAEHVFLVGNTPPMVTGMSFLYQDTPSPALICEASAFDPNAGDAVEFIYSIGLQGQPGGDYFAVIPASATDPAFIVTDPGYSAFDVVWCRAMACDEDQACSDPHTETLTIPFFDHEGPVATANDVLPNPALPEQDVTFFGVMDDTETGNSPIAMALFNVNGGPYSAMSASNGSFDEPYESVEAVFPAPVQPGQYNICLYGEDSAGNPSASDCVELLVEAPNLDQDGDGWEIPLDCNDSDPTIHPGATDHPDQGFVDSNCDGMDGEEENATFVSVDGVDNLLCTKAQPCALLQTGINHASPSGKRDVYVSSGEYPESITLVDGVSVYGGFDATDDWSRDPAVNETRLLGSPGEGVTVLAEGLSAPTVLAGMTLVGQEPSVLGASSYVVYAQNASPSFLVRGNIIVGGRGADGAPGDDGVDAPQGWAPSGRTGGAAGEIISACDATTSGQGGQRVTNSGFGSTESGAGGRGGTADTECWWVGGDLDATRGENGEDSPSSSAQGGQGGSVCGPGSTGQNGHDGNHGDFGWGASSSGRIEAGVWVGYDGRPGEAGIPGGGGAGGGGSGGCDSGIDDFGAGGGSGGSGGLPSNAGGSGGKGAGSSFGLFLVDSNPVVEENTFQLGTGGTGGQGGGAGLGQPGGAGGEGGSPFEEAGPGGSGGDGGQGGNSGAGGGGAGGIVIGVARIGSSLPGLINNTFTGGVVGIGGPGGRAPTGQSDGGQGVQGYIVHVANCGASGCSG